MKILLIGCGKMGGAMLAAWLARDLITHAAVIDPAVHEFKSQFSAHRALLDIYPGLAQLPKEFTPDLVILAVKPQQMTELLSSLAQHIEPHWPVMTVAAGLRTRYYARYLPKNPIIRTMPNTAVMVAQGMTAGFVGQEISAALRKQIEKLWRTAGEFLWIADETKMDAVTAISGSGLAYYYYFTEQLAAAGKNEGLNANDAMQLARQTLIGAGAMAAMRADVSMEHMRHEVTSPGGVTEATLRTWEQDNTFQIFIAAGIAANTNRGQELADC